MRYEWSIAATSSMGLLNINLSPRTLIKCEKAYDTKLFRSVAAEPPYTTVKVLACFYSMEYNHRECAVELYEIIPPNQSNKIFI